MYLLVAVLAFFVGDLTAKSISNLDAEKVEMLEMQRRNDLSGKR